MARSYDVYGDWERFNGRIVEVDGIECVVRTDVYVQRYPYESKVIDVRAEPTGKAKETAFYKGMKAKLRDDWSTDVLSSDIDFQADLLRQLGE